MNRFWTVTNSNTQHTNDRSTRFASYDRAVHEATARIESGRSSEVIILESVAIVRRTAPPIEIISL